MIFEIIDKTKEPVEPQIFLALPNKTIIGKLNEAFNINYHHQLNAINELSFDIPYKIDIHHKFVDNPNIKNIRYRYLIKLVLGNQTEWFLITQLNDNADENKEYLTVECHSLGYELTDRLIVTYDVTSYTLEEMLMGKLTDDMPGILSETNWTVGYVDSDFVLTYRSYSASSKTVLDCIFDIAEIFNALIIWDTDKRKIHFYKPENIGTNKGFTVSYGKYLKTLSKEIDSSEFVTRLKPFGKDNLTINRVNPTGTNYIEDFSYFLYPFEQDANGNVIRHSYYMSDELCKAMLKYQEKLKSKEGVFKNLLAQKEQLENALTQKQNELTELEIELDIIIDNIFVAQTHQEDDSGLQFAKRQKEQEIEDKKDEINFIKNQIGNVDNQIRNLRVELSLENNFSPELIEERNKFIIEKEWRSENHYDDEELYRDAIKYMEELHKPKTVIEIDIVNFLDIVEEQVNWDKLNLGDTITIKYEQLGINAKAKIIGVEYEFRKEDADENNIKLTIANVLDTDDEEARWYKMLKNSISTSTQLDMNKFRWDRAEEDLGIIDQIINNMWNDIKQQLEMAFNETVIIDRRGITIIDPEDPLRFLRATHGVLAITNDGGNTFKHAITADGIVGERIFGKIITGERVIIGDPDGILVINGNKLVVSNRDFREVMWMGLIDTSPDRFGLRLVNDVNRITIDDIDGFTIEKRDGFTWSKKFFADTDGDLYAIDMTAKRLTITNDDDVVLFDAYKGLLNISELETMIIDGKLTPQEKLTLKSEWRRIQAEKEKIVEQANRYMYIEREDEKNAKQLDTELQDYLAAYNALNNVLSILLQDATMHLVTDLNITVGLSREQFIGLFEEYYAQAIRIINSITNVLEKSSVQLGRNYNNTVIDAISGITVTRSDGVVRTIMNATEGISIERLEGGKFTKKFFVDTYGNLHAEDLIAKRLILYNDNNELILDADSNLFDFNKLDFIGQLPAENIIAGIVVNDGIESNFVGNLAVNRFLSLRSEDEGKSVNYIDIKENVIKFNYGTLVRGQQRMQFVNGEWKPLYWIVENGKRISTTINPEEGDEPVYEYIIQNPITKMQLYFDENDPTKPVRIQLGEGTGVGERAKGFIWKTVEGLTIRYVNESDQVQEIKLTNSGIEINAITGNLNVKAGNSYLQFSSNGNVKLYASGTLNIESGSHTYIKTGGNLYLN